MSNKEFNDKNYFSVPVFFHQKKEEILEILSEFLYTELPDYEISSDGHSNIIRFYDNGKICEELSGFSIGLYTLNKGYCNAGDFLFNGQILYDGFLTWDTEEGLKDWLERLKKVINEKQ